MSLSETLGNVLGLITGTVGVPGLLLGLAALGVLVGVKT